MVQIDVLYEGDLHTTARHGPSGAALATDAPVDNAGRGASFSPTDLVATAIGSCMLTVMGIVAQRRNIDMTGARARVLKDMVADPVRRIGKLEVTIDLPAGLEPTERKVLENAARSCPVHKSLHPEVEVPLTFRYHG